MTKIYSGTEQKMITGYQWGIKGQFIGTYEFHNNQDKDELHVPPFTTLVCPPVFAVGQEAIWNGEGWMVQKQDLSHLWNAPAADYQS